MSELIKSGYARVTEITSDREALNKIPPDILENARLRGNRVDELCKAYIQGLPAFPEREDDAGFFKSFSLWADNKQADLDIGQRMYDDKLMLTGVPDFIRQENGLNILVDIKATSAESPTWKLQGAGYAYLLREHGLHIDKIEFVRLKKDGTKPVVYLYDDEFVMFMHFYHRYKFLNKHKDENDEYLRCL